MNATHDAPVAPPAPVLASIAPSAPGFHFEVDPDSGSLLRYVRPRRGEPYVHACPLEALKDVCHAIDDLGPASFTIESIYAAEGVQATWTNIAVAFAFLHERGIIDRVRSRKNAAVNPGGVYLDAMVEYYAMLEEPR